MRKKAAFALLWQTALIWAVLFLGWGLDDLRSFFSHPARLGLFGVAMLGTAYVLLAGLEVNPFRKGEKPVQRQRWHLGSLMVLVLFFVWFLPYADRREIWTIGSGDPIRYAGLALNAGGTGIRLAALRTLGRHFSGYVTLQTDHQLVQTGLYSLIRHPMYVGGLLAIPGLALVFRSWLVVPMTLLGVLFLTLRIQKEEKLLAEHFGTEFAAYRQRTWRLLPFIY